jgi:hypothetical protein
LWEFDETSEETFLWKTHNSSQINIQQNEKNQNIPNSNEMKLSEIQNLNETHQRMTEEYTITDLTNPLYFEKNANTDTNTNTNTNSNRNEKRSTNTNIHTNTNTNALFPLKSEFRANSTLYEAQSTHSSTSHTTPTQYSPPPVVYTRYLQWLPREVMHFICEIITVGVNEEWENKLKLKNAN